MSSSDDEEGSNDGPGRNEPLLGQPSPPGAAGVSQESAPSQSSQELTAPHYNDQQQMTPLPPPNPMALYQGTGFDPYYHEFLRRKGHLDFLQRTGRHSAPTIPADWSFNNTVSTPQAQAADANSQDSKKKKAKANSANKDGKKKKSVAQEKKGGAHKYFSTEEVDKLLDIIDEVVPMGNVCWQTVTDKFNEAVETEERHRELKALQRKFGSMHSKKVPTGNPYLPPQIARAKDLQKKIMERSEYIDAEEASSEDDGEVNGSEEEGETPPPPPPKKGATTKKKRKHGSRVKRGKQKRGEQGSESEEEQDFLKVFLATEKVHQRRHEANMQMMFELVTAAVSAYMGSNANNGGNGLAFASNVQNLFQQNNGNNTQQEDDDEDDNISSINTDDSPPTKRAKTKAKKRKKQNRKGKSNKAADSDSDES